VLKAVVGLQRCTSVLLFTARLGGQLATEAHCTSLVVGLRKAAPRSKRARLFGRCLGLLEPAVPQAGTAWIAVVNDQDLAVQVLR
jgi:hypothetical protein